MLKYPRCTLAIALSLALFSTSLVFAETLPMPKGVVAGASVEGISEYTLANGMKVLLFPDASKATTTVNVTYNVGSLHENYGETGMAHLLEHMLFKGTPTGSFSPDSISLRTTVISVSRSLRATNELIMRSASNCKAQFNWV